MNPFEEIENTNTNLNNFHIEIWVENMGRKKNTYISGWSIDIEDLKNHLKNIKKKNGCNGSIKNNNIVQLQGDHTDYMTEYIINTGIDSNNIIIKG